MLGKARVLPLKAVFIPRLELSATTLSVKMKAKIVEIVDILPDNITSWTDRPQY